MTIYLNNIAMDVEEEQTLHSFLESNQLMDKGGIAVAINDTVISKSNWTTKKLNHTDKLTVITATAGG